MVGIADVVKDGEQVDKSDLREWGQSVEAPTATGTTTARSLADRFALVIHPEDEGAVGDGATDDTDAVEAAINAALAIGHGHVHLTKTYRLTRTILFEDETGITITADFGAGFVIADSHDYTVSASFSSTSYLNRTMFTFIRCHRLRIEGVTFQGDLTLFQDGSGEQVGEWNHFIEIRGCSDVTVTENWCDQPNGDAVYLAGDPDDASSPCRRVTVSRNRFFDSRRLSVAAVNVNVLSVTENHKLKTLDMGADATAEVYNGFFDLEPNGNEQGNNVSVSGNISIGGAISVYSRHAAEEDTNNIKITNNLVVGMSIFVKGANDFTVENNTVIYDPPANLTFDRAVCYSIRQTTSPGTRDGNNKRGIVKGNLAKISGTSNTDRIGFYFNAAEDVLFEGNKTVGIVTRGLQIVSGRDITVRGNDLHGSEFAIIANQLFDWNTAGGGTQSSNNVRIVDNDFTGLVWLVSIGSDMEFAFDDNRVAGRVRVGHDDADGDQVLWVRRNSIRATGAAENGLEILSASDSGGNRIVVEGGDITAEDGYGIRVNSALVVDIIGVAVTSDDVPIYIAAPSGEINATSNTLRDLSGSPTHAIQHTGTSTTGKLAGNVLLSPFASPYRLRNTAIDARQQWMESDADPSSGGWANSQTWGASQIIWNSAVAAGGAPGWVCTTAGTPGTWKAMANVAA